jgi:hypothetical protein
VLGGVFFVGEGAVHGHAAVIFIVISVLAIVLALDVVKFCAPSTAIAVGVCVVSNWDFVVLLVEWRDENGTGGIETVPSVGVDDNLRLVRNLWPFQDWTSSKLSRSLVVPECIRSRC